MPDDGVSDNHSIVSHQRSEAVAGGNLEEGRGGGCLPRPGSLLPLLNPGSVISRRWSEEHLGRSHPGCTGPVQRNTWNGGGGSVSSVLHTYPGHQPRMFPALLSAPSAGPVSQATHESATPRPPAAPDAARTCPHLHTKVDTNLPLKQVTVKQWKMCVNRVLAVLAGRQPRC